jgi:hypothetical protein
MPRRPPFVYNPPSPDWIRRQIHRREWPQALYAAYRNDDASGLCRYLRSELELDAEKREQLAVLLERRIQHRPRGRRPGTDVTPASAGQARLEAIARSRLRRMRSANAGRVPSGAIRAVVVQVAEVLGEEGCWGLDVDKAVKNIRRHGVSPRRR